MNLFYFTYESHNNLSHLVSLSVKNLKTEHSCIRTQHEIQNINYKNYLLWFGLSTQHRIWSFVVAIFQWTSKKCTNSYHGHAQQVFFSFNLFLSKVPLVAS